MSDAAFTVIDLGGTTLRTARYGVADDAVTDVRRVPTDGIAGHPGRPVAELQARVLDQVAALAAEAVARHGSGAVCVSFAGPVTADGRALAAPTVWGGPGEQVAVRQRLEERLGLPVVVVNDLTAAVWRYVDPADDRPFCLITVSSGIGNKVYRAGEVLLDTEGHGGEIGHWTVDPSPDAAPCDCGGRGHLGALASGRGALAAARRAALADPAGYARSALAASAPDPELLDNRALVAAVRAGDAFATAAVRVGITALATAITAVFTSIGIRRYVLIGGFALALGARYAELLTAELERLGCFGLTPEEVRQMVVLGAEDDDSGLIGAGRLLAATLPAPAPAPAPTR
ncbi:ROK family protein [Kitasatospora sp. NA04385]|uniref:ROK family protein n=1 Tax=Kitasatospora sp. NA04385 TaxID=2742135 RepID=UPI0015906D26|nr:ROK family protein [Kitasatospora sp. NA04385]QKW23270.1 ROK family protein [Kitasatospora sp. NA04385]